MKKLVKLPLFLGVCGAACAGILAAANLITAPIIEQNALIAENQNVIKMFDGYDISITEMEVSADLAEVGVSKKVGVSATNLTGVVYSVTTTTKGFSDVISYQIAFANGKFHGFSNIANSETSGYGADLISALEQGTYSFGDLSSSYNFDGKAGATRTTSALRTSINAVVADYMKDYRG